MKYEIKVNEGTGIPLLYSYDNIGEANTKLTEICKYFGERHAITEGATIIDLTKDGITKRRIVITCSAF